MVRVQRRSGFRQTENRRGNLYAHGYSRHLTFYTHTHVHQNRENRLRSDPPHTSSHSTRREFRLFLTVPNERQLPVLFPCAESRASALAAHCQNQILNKTGNMMLTLIRTNKVIDCSILDAVGANLLGVYDSAGRPLITLLQPTRKTKKKGTPKSGGEAVRWLKSPLLRTIFYFGVLHHARRMQLSEWSCECVFSGDTLRYIVSRIASLSSRLQDFPWAWYTATMCDVYCGQVVDPFWSRSLQSCLKQWSNSSANPADSLAPAEKVVALGDSAAASCVAKMMDLQAATTLCYDQVVSQQKHLYDSRLICPAGFDVGDIADPSAADVAADDGNVGAEISALSEVDRAVECEGVVGDTDTSVAVAEDATGADTTGTGADTDVDMDVFLMQRWLDQGRLPELTKLLERVISKLSLRVDGQIQTELSQPHSSFLHVALQREKQRLTTTLSVIRRSLAELMEAHQLNDLYMRPEGKPDTERPLPGSSCYFYRRVELRDVARSLHALRVPRAWIGRQSSQGELLSWFQNFARKLEYLHSVTDSKGSKPHNHLWVRALSNPHFAINAAAIDMFGAHSSERANASVYPGAIRRAFDGWPIASTPTRHSFRCSAWRLVPKDKSEQDDGKQDKQLCLSGLLLFGCRWDVASDRLIQAPAAISSSMLQEMPPLQLERWQIPEATEQTSPAEPIEPTPPTTSKTKLSFKISRSKTNIAGNPRSPLMGSPRASSGSKGRQSRAASFGSPRQSPSGSLRPPSGSSGPPSGSGRSTGTNSPLTTQPVPEPEASLEYSCPVYAFPSGSVSASGNPRHNGGVVCSVHLLCQDKNTLNFCETRCVSLFCRAEE